MVEVEDFREDRTIFAWFNSFSHEGALYQTIGTAPTPLHSYPCIMVITRSADKRLDTTREEDLVLRSRTIGSPSSNASTPSQPRKRTANLRENASSPRPKRARFGTDGAVDEASQVVVNVPLKTGGWEVDTIPRQSKEVHGFEMQANGSNNTDTEVTGGDSHTTPKARVMTTSETPDLSNETFKTPATSKHKRFDSDELDDETILVGTGIDPSVPQGYQTADEEIGDSDDNDTPEVATTKVAPKMPQRKPPRTSKGKKKLVAVTDIGDIEDDETIVVAPSQTVNESRVATHQPTSSGERLEDTVKEQNRLNENIEQSSTVVAYDNMEISSLHGPNSAGSRTLTSPPSHSTSALLHTPPERKGSSLSQNKSQRSGSALSPFESMDLIISRAPNVEWPAVPKPSLQGVSASDSTTSSARIAPNRGLRSTHNSSFSYMLTRPKQTQGRETSLTPATAAVRLPAKASTILSDYRRNKIQQRAAKGVGGIQMESNWAKKRGMFVVS